MKKILLLCISLIVLSSCTKNSRARNFGGIENVKLKENEVLLNTTWDVFIYI